MNSKLSENPENLLCSKVFITFRLSLSEYYIDIKSLQNRLLMVCYVPAISIGLNRLLLFLFAAAVKKTNEANKAGGTCC
jgi:hypothetical protein